MHIENKDKMCIPVPWWTIQSPSVEKLIHVFQDHCDHLYAIWAWWLGFRDSEGYQNLL